MKKTITIAIPVYNGEKYILEALQSIIDQTIQIDNIVVCDNGSTDNTTKITKQFFNDHKAFNSSLIVNDENIGSYKNFVKCFEICTSGYLLILGSDDRLKRDCIEKQMNLFNENPELALIGGNYDIINENGQIIHKNILKGTNTFNKGEILEYMHQTNLWLQHSSVMMNLNHLKKLGFWDEIYIACDEKYYAKVLQNFPIVKIRESVVEIRMHSEQITDSENLRYNDKIIHFQENLKVAHFEKNPERCEELKNALKKWTADQCIAIGRRLWKYNKAYSISLKYWTYGIKLKPSYLFKYRFLKTLFLSILNK